MRLGSVIFILLLSSQSFALTTLSIGESTPDGNYTCAKGSQDQRVVVRGSLDGVECSLVKMVESVQTGTTTITDTTVYKVRIGNSGFVASGYAITTANEGLKQFIKICKPSM